MFVLPCLPARARSPPPHVPIGPQHDILQDDDDIDFSELAQADLRHQQITRTTDGGGPAAGGWPGPVAAEDSWTKNVSLTADGTVITTVTDNPFAATTTTHTIAPFSPTTAALPQPTAKQPQHNSTPRTTADTIDAPAAATSITYRVAIV